MERVVEVPTGRVDHRAGWAHDVGGLACIVMLAFLAGLVVWTPAVGRAFGLGEVWPLAQGRHPLQPLTTYWWPTAFAVVVVSGCLLTRWLRLPVALIVVGVPIVALGAALALRPIPSAPQQAGGAADCNAVLFGSGPYGDSDEVCFDVRKARAFDSLLLGSTGALVGAAGVALLLRRERPAEGT